MSTARGPVCFGGCGKRVSANRTPCCPWCGRALCLKCLCPAKCYEKFVKPRAAEGTPTGPAAEGAPTERKEP